MGIELRQLSKSFAAKPVIDQLSLNISSQEFTCLLGPSGCGKTTLLRLIAGLETPDVGSVARSSELKQFSYVFQSANLLPWRTVLENVLLPLELTNSSLSASQRKEKALLCLERVRLEKAADLFPHELSGGMQMRASLARALVTSPQLLLLDEPFAALDELSRFELQEELLDLQHKEKISVVFVTHSLAEASFLAQRMILIGKKGADVLMDKKINYAAPRTPELRTSSELNQVVAEFSQRLRHG